MVDRTEAVASQCLRASLAPLSAGASIEKSEEFLAFQSALERFLPAELGWEGESFDAFRFVRAQKVAPDEAEFIGLALLISDQSWIPIHLRLRISPDSDQIAFLDCRVGEPGDGALGLETIPYRSGSVNKVLHRLPEQIESMLWVYRATRGLNAQ